MPTKTNLIDSAQAAAILERDRSIISRWVRAGKLTPAAEGTGIRGARFFKRTDVERLRKELDAKRAA